MGFGIPAPELRFGVVLLALLAAMWLAGARARRDGRALGSGRAVALAAVYGVLYAAFVAPLPATVSLCAVLGALAAHELAAANASSLGRPIAAPLRVALCVLGAVAPWLLAAAEVPSAAAARALGALLLALLVVFQLVAASRPQVRLTLAACFAIAALDAFVLLRAGPEGSALCLFAFFLLNVSDTAAYFAGKLFGRRKLAPQLSPGKTLEGSLGALVATVACAFLFDRVLQLRLPAAHVVAVALLLNILGQLGDLLASALKRQLGVKDFGTLLGGHGGVLDRFDSCLLAVPAFLIWMRFAR